MMQDALIDVAPAVMQRGEMMNRLPEDSFSWLRWLYGLDVWVKLGIACREKSIVDNAETLRKHAIGYIPAERLRCRPKENEVAVMFLIEDRFVWTHLSSNEYERVFIC